MPDEPLYINTDQLCVGLYIHLDRGWMEHSFTFSSFKIKDEKQLNTLRALGFPRLRYDPKRSDCRPLPSAASAAPAVAAEPAAPPAPSPEELAAMQAKQARIEQLKALRRNLAEVNKKFQQANNTVKNISRNLRSQPQETLRQAEELVEQMVEAMLGEDTVLMHALNGKAGEDAYFHSLNVTVLSIMLARILQFSHEDTLQLGLGALLHDIGKLDIPSKILLKTEPLNKAELGLLHLHCDYGIKLAARMELSEAAQRIIREHHELSDGSGYPRQLKGPQISPLARVVSIANQYDNLCNPPNLAEALTPHEALSKMFTQQRAHFDPEALKAFIRCLGVYPPGCIVQLSNEMIGLVLAVNPNKPLRPTVIVYDPEVPKEEAIILDLEREAELNISKSLRPGQLPHEIYNYLSPRQHVTYYFDPQQAAAS
ncbi:MAG: HD-GYP domain-containing protein [Pseudomonas sp.]|nr:HD-GYP domain-containing protein [Pseudomonas sp.]